MQEILEQVLNEIKSLKEDVDSIKNGQEELSSEIKSSKKSQGELYVEIKGLKKGYNELYTQIKGLKNEIKGLKKGQEELYDHIKACVEHSSMTRTIATRNEEKLTSMINGIDSIEQAQNEQMDYILTKLGKQDMEIHILKNKVARV